MQSNISFYIGGNSSHALGNIANDYSDIDKTTKIIGTWVDSRPIYRKMFIINVPSDASISVSNPKIYELSIDDIVDTVVDISTVFGMENTNTDSGFNVESSVDSDSIRVAVNKPTNQLWVSLYKPEIKGKQIRVILDYCKTPSAQ